MQPLHCQGIPHRTAGLSPGPPALNISLKLAQGIQPGRHPSPAFSVHDAIAWYVSFCCGELSGHRSHPALPFNTPEKPLQTAASRHSPPAAGLMPRDGPSTAPLGHQAPSPPPACPGCRPAPHTRHRLHPLPSAPKWRPCPPL